MKAMLFAAGLATRLRPITDKVPKALLPLGGRTLLQIIAERLIAAGVDSIVVNVHHHAGMMKDFIERLNYPGVSFHISDETTQLLDTGGGLKQARQWLGGDQPFFIYNADIISNIDLKQLLMAHQPGNALATLAASNRSAVRYFLWDGDELAGWENIDTGEKVFCRQTHTHPTKNKKNGNAPKSHPFIRKAYSGMAVVSPDIFGLMSETGVFSIRDVFLRLAKEHAIRCFEHEHESWHDIGTPEKLERARRYVEMHHGI